MAREASGPAERAAAWEMLDGLKDAHGVQPTTLGVDEGFDGGAFFRAREGRRIEPHVPRVKAARDPKAVAYQKQVAGVEARQRMKGRMGTEGDRLRQKCRKKIEEGFGWLKQVAGLGRSRGVGRWELQQWLEIGAAAYNPVRLRKLTTA